MSEIVKASGYDKILLDLIPKLDNYTSISGADGTAYFIDDRFVVKKITRSRTRKLFDEIFEYYFEEMKSYAEKGYSVPKFYAWAKFENENHGSDIFSMPYDYYILEERLPGRQLYLSNKIVDLYNCFESVCSEEDFKKVLLSPAKYKSLIKEVVQIYVKDFIDVNTRIEAMSDADLEKFVFSIYKMYEEGKYNVPDVYTTNVLLSEKNKLGIIDNFCIDKERGFYSEKGDTAQEFVTVMMLELLTANVYMKENYHVKWEREQSNSDLERLIRENEKINEAVIVKIFNIMKKRSGKISIEKKYVYDSICDLLADYIGKERVADFMQENGIQLS